VSNPRPLDTPPSPRHEWAVDVWFNEDGAKIIANADRKTDKIWHPLTSWLTAQKYHFNKSNTGEDSREIIAINRYDTAVSIWKEALKVYNKDKNLNKLQKQKNKALEHLGIGLHALQDQQAHGDFIPSWPKNNNKSDVFHGPGYDDIFYDWRNWSDKTILGSRSDTPGKRYYMTALVSTLYLYSFRVDVGLAVPKK